ncbi:hypothetical protein B7463_g6602, partial [Scytalidium lignicola]
MVINSKSIQTDVSSDIIGDCHSCRENARGNGRSDSPGAKIEQERKRMPKMSPTNSVTDLEMQVARLKAEIAELRREKEAAAQAQSSNASLSSEHQHPAVGMPLSEHGTSPGDISHADQQEMNSDPRDLVRTIGLVALESTSEPRFMGTSSGLSFAKMVMGAIKCEQPAPTPQSTTGARGPVLHAAPPNITSSLPPRHVADHIINAYFQHRTPHFMILERHQVQRAVDNVYKNYFSEPHESRQRIIVDKDLFTTYMILAIGLCGIAQGPGEGRPTQSEGCFNSAMKSIDAVFIYPRSGLETLSAILLLCQYVTLCPSKGSLWQLSGTALRLCIEIGLHWETEPVLKMDPIILNERRRLYWASYNFDRLLVIPLGRPFGIFDQSTNAGYPDPWLNVTNTSEMHYPEELREMDIHHKRAANHVTTLYKLQSEIKHVLYHQMKGASPAFPQPDYNVWIRDVRPRLEEWQASIPPVHKAHPQSIFASQAWWDAMYSSALLLLYRPNPRIPCLTPSSLDICYEISCRTITSIKMLHREQRIDIPWIWVHQLILAGLTMVYCVWHSDTVLNRISFQDLIDMTQRCSSVLAALAERFPGAAGCRDAFEMLSVTTLKWFVAKDSNVIHQEESSFSRFLQTIQQQADGSASYPYPRTQHAQDDDQMMLLPEDPLEFGELLATAAQWPPVRGDYDLTLESMFDNLADPAFSR